MPLRTSPINKDSKKTEGFDAAGQPLGRTSKEQSAFAKVPRLSRERRRYRLPTGYQKLVTKMKDVASGEVTINESYNQYYETCEGTIDTIHNPSYKPKKLPKGRIIDSGGKFSHWKIEYKDIVTENIHFILRSETIDVDRVGHLWLTPPAFTHDGIDVAYSIEPPKEDFDLSEIGPALWKMMNPTKLSVDLGVNIAEVRDLPRLVKGKLDSLKSFVSSLSNPKGLADWLLAVQFGWNPLKADIKKCINLYYKMEARIEFLMRNGGKPLHRRIPVPITEVFSEVLFEYEGPDNQGWMLDEVPLGEDPDELTDRFKCKLVVKKTTTKTASGVFTYHLGDIPPTPAYLRLKLLGLIPNQALLWEATPWSWLIDWFSNMGDVISNIESNLRDRVVSLYAYSQRQIVREYTFTCSNGYYDLAVTRVYDTKCREKIDPFGLAADVGLTDIQLGILVALGITRS